MASGSLVGPIEGVRRVDVHDRLMAGRGADDEPSVPRVGTGGFGRCLLVGSAVGIRRGSFRRSSHPRQELAPPGGIGAAAPAGVGPRAVRRGRGSRCRWVRGWHSPRRPALFRLTSLHAARNVGPVFLILRTRHELPGVFAYPAAGPKSPWTAAAAWMVWFRCDELGCPGSG